ncbi:MAG: nucleotidyltransferase family protein [Clostridia bacterium]|nr:nucleotidyltransferase family protein [Clostridia bacterium]
MDRSQRLLVSLLSAAIRGQKPEISINEEINWEAVFEEAIAHDVHALVFPAVKDLDATVQPEHELLLQWEKAALLAGVKQVQHIEDVRMVLETLDQAGIPVIALKGLVLRELYPQPELRTMVDADILVHEEDMEKAKGILSRLGYYEESRDSKHIHFEHKTKKIIELHKTLVLPESFDKPFISMDSLWRRAKPCSIAGIPTQTLSDEDHLLHLSLHMAEHIKAYGFGLRQLCDFALLIERRGNSTDWNLFDKRIELMGITRFVQIMFHVCDILLGIRLPKNGRNTQFDRDKSSLDLLINDIISGGVYGQRGSVRHVGNQILRYSKRDDAEKQPNKVALLFSYLFPPVKRLGTRYTYTKHYPFLYPIAWVHRLFFNILYANFKKVYSTVFTESSASISLFQERQKLLQWLGLE